MRRLLRQFISIGMVPFLVSSSLEANKPLAPSTRLPAQLSLSLQAVPPYLVAAFTGKHPNAGIITRRPPFAIAGGANGNPVGDEFFVWIKDYFLPAFHRLLESTAAQEETDPYKEVVRLVLPNNYLKEVELRRLRDVIPALIVSMMHTDIRVIRQAEQLLLDIMTRVGAVDLSTHDKPLPAVVLALRLTIQSLVWPLGGNATETTARQFKELWPNSSKSDDPIILSIRGKRVVDQLLEVVKPELVNRFRAEINSLEWNYRQLSEGNTDLTETIEKYFSGLLNSEELRLPEVKPLETDPAPSAAPNSGLDKSDKTPEPIASSPTSAKKPRKPAGQIKFLSYSPLTIGDPFPFKGRSKGTLTITNIRRDSSGNVTIQVRGERAASTSTFGGLTLRRLIIEFGVSPMRARATFHHYAPSPLDTNPKKGDSTLSKKQIKSLNALFVGTLESVRTALGGTVSLRVWAHPDSENFAVTLKLKRRGAFAALLPEKGKYLLVLSQEGGNDWPKDTQDFLSYLKNLDCVTRTIKQSYSDKDFENLEFLVQAYMHKGADQKPKAVKRILSTLFVFIGTAVVSAWPSLADPLHPVMTSRTRTAA